MSEFVRLALSKWLCFRRVSQQLALPESTASALAARWPVSAGVAAGSAPAVRLVGGGVAEFHVALAGVAEARRVAAVTEASAPAAFDLALTVCGEDLAAVGTRLARPGAPRCRAASR